MGRTIAKLFFYHDIKGSNRRTNKNENNSTAYFDDIPIKFDKIYRTIDVELEHECNSTNVLIDYIEELKKLRGGESLTDPKEEKLIEEDLKNFIPQIVVLDKFLNELILYITNSKRYISVKYDIVYTKECPFLLDLIKSHIFFMNYLHVPKRKDGIWFCEGRFLTKEELSNKTERDAYNSIIKFVKEKGIKYMEFLEEWVGLVFHLATEYLLLKKRLKTIFFSCEKCHRPGVFIKEELKSEDDPNKILGTINIVDTIIESCVNDMKLSFGSPKSENNIILFDKSYNPNNKEISKEYENFKDETNGAFILIKDDLELDNLIDEFKSKGNNFKFDLIITGSTGNEILEKIDKKSANNYFDRKCIYRPIKDNNNQTEYIKEIYNKSEDIKKFINLKNQKQEIYPTIKLLTYKEYINKYIVLHQLISRQYGQNGENKFKIEISYIKDFLLWNPKLNVENNDNELKIDTFLKTLQEFEKIKNDQEYIVKLYTYEKGSYYKDFNNWLLNLDPLAIQKTSWFIAASIFSLNQYSIKKEKGIRTDGLKIYRGLKANLSDLLYYESALGELICFPSFTSTSKRFDVAKEFSTYDKKQNQYSTIITINYKFKEGFIPTAVDVSQISRFKNEEECLFFPYSFFKVIKFEIDHTSKKAKIELDSIGRKEIIETKLGFGYKLVYNEEECLMDLVK